MHLSDGRTQSFPKNERLTTGIRRPAVHAGLSFLGTPGMGVGWAVKVRCALAMSSRALAEGKEGTVRWLTYDGL